MYVLTREMAPYLVVENHGLLEILLSLDEIFLQDLQPAKRHEIVRGRLAVGRHELVGQCRLGHLSREWSQGDQMQNPAEGEGTPIYLQYRDVPPDRVSFLGSSV